MAHFVLICQDKPASLDLRMATRDAHLAYAKASGCVRAGGPFLDAYRLYADHRDRKSFRGAQLRGP